MSEARVLAGRYELEDVLGVGGMSVVHRARDLVTGQLVAVKVVASHLAGDPVIGDRFSAEAEHLRSSSHPNLVRILDVGEDGGDRFLVMELIAGETLEQQLHRAGTLPLAEVAAIVTAVGGGLAALHAQGLVHRDVKPANILLGTDGVTRLADFGLVRGVPMGLTLPGTTVGTLSYLAPELLHGAEATPASDAWALGAVGYRALTGVLPYPSTTVVDLVNEHARPPIPPSLVDARLPAAVDAPFLSVLGPRSARPSPLELGAALSAIAVGGVAAGMATDWSAATTAVLGTAAGSGDSAIPGAGSAKPTVGRHRIPLRAAAIAVSALLVAAIVVAAGVPRNSTAVIPGAIGTLSQARTPSSAVTRTTAPVSEAAQRRVAPPPAKHDHGPRQGHGAGHGPPPGHGHGPRHGGHAGGDDQGENGD